MENWKISKREKLGRGLALTNSLSQLLFYHVFVECRIFRIDFHVLPSFPWIFEVFIVVFVHPSYVN